MNAASKRVSSVSLPAEDLDLAFFGLRRRMEAHRAAAEQHDGGDALVDVGDEHRALGEREVEILGGDLQIARRELLAPG